MDPARRREQDRIRAAAWRKANPERWAAIVARHRASAKGKAAIEAWKERQREGRPPGGPRGGKVAAIACTDCGKALDGRARKHRTSRCGACWSRRMRERNRDILRAAKAKPCADCGRSYPHYVMDLDHRRGKKVRACSRMHQTGARMLKAEIAKCDVVCANCHRERTHG
jgi:hypothetical protein